MSQNGYSKNIAALLSAADADDAPVPDPHVSRASIHAYIPINGSALKRPLNMPQTARKGLILLVAAAVIIGAVFLFRYFDDMINEPAREQELLEASLAKEADLDFPSLVSLMSLTNEEILATLQAEATGDDGESNVLELSSDSDDDFEVVRLASDVSLADAMVMYVSGISSLSAAEAAMLLNGSWDLEVDRSSGVNIAVHYADFSSGSVEQAISTAAQQQGFDTSGNIDSGTDSSQNTYMAGTVEGSDGKTYSWRVSGIALSEVYSQSGLPDDAVYVGIRVTS